MTGGVERHDLAERLQVARDGTHRVRDDVDGAEHVIRIRVERHVEAAEQTLVDLEVRSAEMPPAGSYARRRLERDLGRLESEVAFAQAKLEAALAEEGQDVRGFARATRRAMAVTAPRYRSP